MDAHPLAHTFTCLYIAHMDRVRIECYLDREVKRALVAILEAEGESVSSWLRRQAMKKVGQEERWSEIEKLIG